VKTATDAGGYVRSFQYDNLDRVLKVVYPDGTSDSSVYSRLDVASETDRLGRTTRYAYNALRQLTQVTYPKSPGDPDRILKLNWCGCGALSSLADPKGQLTRWTHDLQGRMTGKFYPGTKGSVPDEAYAYEATTSRLHKAFSQNNPGPALETDYSYDADDRLHAINYDAGMVKSQSTPGVTFLYDTNYPRLIGMTDGVGTTQYSYYPPGSLGAGQVQDEDGPWDGDTLHYTYDALERRASRTVNGQGKAQQAYDALGRLASETNPLGKFTYGYLGTTAQVSSVKTLLPTNRPGLSNLFTYLDNQHDRRLQRLQQKVGNAQTVLATYAYAYDAVGNITSWSQQQKGQPLFKASYQYDGIDQLLQVSPAAASAGSHYLFDYDQVGNRTEANVDGNAVTETSNALNQLAQSSTGGAYQYDTGGNRTADSANHRQYAWDGAGRLLSVVEAEKSGNHSDFAYDGLGRLRTVKEYQNSIVKSEKRYVWCGLERCEERSASNAFTKRYYGQGELRGGTPLYYSRDHLGSVRELTDASGAVQAQYRYDPWGQMTKLVGSLDADLRYTGHYYHAPSGLHLAPFRAYEAQTGRWISRDRMGEYGGNNLYGYAFANPLRLADPLGFEGDNVFKDVKDKAWDEAKKLLFDDPRWDPVTKPIDSFKDTLKDKTTRKLDDDLRKISDKFCPQIRKTERDIKKDYENDPTRRQIRDLEHKIRDVEKEISKRINDRVWGDVPDATKWPQWLRDARNTAFPPGVYGNP
jgi:RHS repeat-associated protein